MSRKPSIPMTFTVRCRLMRHELFPVITVLLAVVFALHLWDGMTAPADAQENTISASAPTRMVSAPIVMEFAERSFK